MSEFSCVATVRPAVDAVPSAEVKGNGIESFPSEEALYTNVVVIITMGMVSEAPSWSCSVQKINYEFLLSKVVLSTSWEVLSIKLVDLYAVKDKNGFAKDKVAILERYDKYHLVYNKVMQDLPSEQKTDK